MMKTKTGRQLALVLGAAAILAPAGLAAATTTVPPAADDNDDVFVIGSVAVPAGEPGAVGVVMQGPSDGSSVPLVVRNNSTDTLYNFQVEGLARDAAGALVASGSSLGFQPALVEPGDWAMGSVYFDYDVLSGDEQFQFQWSADTDPGFLSNVDVTVSEATINAGSFGLQAVGVVINETAEEVAGPIGVTMACFDDAGQLLSVEDGFTEGDALQAGGFSSFSIDVFDADACPNAALAASGYDF